MSGDDPHWITPEVAIAINDEAVILYGGTSGIRSIFELQEALADPREVWRDTDFDFAAIAAAYIMAFVTRKPFKSANEHTAWAVMDAFIRLNGRSLRADLSGAFKMIRDAESGRAEYDAVAAWVRRHIGGAG